MKVPPPTTTTEADTNNTATSDNNTAAAQSVEQLRNSFEKQLQSKIGGIAAKPDAAEVVTVLGKTAVFCGGSPAGQEGGAGDVRIVHVGPTGESELVLAHLVEGMYEALGNLMGGSTDRAMVLDNLELVFLLIDEHCDGGVILETDGQKLAGSVLLRDEHEVDPTGMGMESSQNGGGMPGQTTAVQSSGGMGGLSMGMGGGDMTIGQALMQARNQIMANLNQT